MLAADRSAIVGAIDSTDGTAVDRYRLAIPAVLQQARIWLVWRFESAIEAGKKPLKIPYYANGGRRSGTQGSPDDVKQLATFDAALAAFQSGSYTGLGIAHIPGCGFNSFDFDNCIDEHGTIYPELEELVRSAGTYVEISPSGRGLRMIARGSLPSIKRIHEGGYNVEVFGETGFVTVTAHNIAGDDVCILPLPILATLNAWLQADTASPSRSRAEQLENAKGMDPVFQRLRQSGRVRKEWPDGKVSIRCPFEDEHTSGPGISDTVYFLPNTHGYASGHFQCLHAHCAHRTDTDFNIAIGFPNGNPLQVLAIESGLFVPVNAFMAAWKPYEYLVKGILQRGHLVSLTGHSNAGKTAIAIKTAFAVASGKPLGNHRTTRGRVVYFAGENADDVRSRFIALTQDMRLDANQLDDWLFIAPIAFPLAANTHQVKQELAKLGAIALIVIDTRAAYAAAMDENDNMQALSDAKAARSLMETSGKPACLVLNHPPHGATDEGLRPRGGSAYWGEIDANLTVWNDGSGNITLSFSKIRGAHFEPVTLTLRQFTLAGFVQPDGDPVVSIVADVTTDDQAEDLDNEVRSDEDVLLCVMAAKPTDSMRKWCAAAGWTWSKRRMTRLLKMLAGDGLVRLYRRRWVIGKKGSDEAEKLVAKGVMTPKDTPQR